MRRAIVATRLEEDFSAWRATLSGLCASLVGIGLARFAYTPLIPALIGADWFTPSQAAYLGAANLAGYLAGALLARPLAAGRSAATVLRAMMVLAALSFFACAVPLSFLWFFAWRFIAGLSGGALMVLAAPTVLPRITPSRRGLASGAIFSGVGLGIAASGTLVPLLMRAGLVETWCGLGIITLALTALAWGGWPDRLADMRPIPKIAAAKPTGRGLKALYIEYGLVAVGMVPHMVFLVDFVARGLGEGLETGARYWVLFGLGAAIGPILAGYVADRIGFAAALRLCFIIQATFVAVLAITAGPIWLTASSIVVGALTPGSVPLVFGRTQELAPPESQKAAWSVATIAFALGQAVAAYGYSFLFARDGSYTLLFELGAAATLLALTIDILACALRPRHTVHTIGLNASSKSE